MKHYYSHLYSDYVLTLDDAKIMLKEDDLEEMELEEMKRDYVLGEMYCNKKEYFIEEGDCGKFCNMYYPCNGKSGRCRRLENGFIGTGKKFVLTKDGLQKNEGINGSKTI